MTVLKVDRSTHRMVRTGVPIMFILLILALWQTVCQLQLVPDYLLPSPVQVVVTLFEELPLLGIHVWTTMSEALLGLAIAVVLAFVFAVVMDKSEVMYHGLYPIIVLTQTVPAVAIAPLLVLWFGYGIAPKVVLIVIVCFFPVLVNLLAGYKSVDQEALTMMRLMGAKEWQIFRLIKIKAGLGGFFEGMKIAASYAVVGGVIAEWLGGTSGLGVYMTQVRKSYAYDKMFAVIILVSMVSLLLLGVVNVARKACMPWEKLGNNRRLANENRKQNRKK